MSDINFDKYGNEEFFKLFLEASKDTYDDYCKLKAREENLTKYSEPVFEKAIDEAGLRISSIEQKLAKANEYLNNPQGLQEFVCVEQMKDIPLLEINRAHQKLHEENNRLNERVKHLESDKEKLMSRYGDNWYDGFMTAKDLGFDRYSESEILQMSEAYEDEKIKSNNLSKADQLINKFAIENRIKALESCIDDNAMDNDEIDALIIYVDDVRSDIEQLRRGNDSE